MTPVEVAAAAAVASVLLSLAALAFTVVTARSKSSTDRTSKLERALDSKADCETVAALVGKTQILETSLTRVETRLDHMPSKDMAHALENSVTMLNGKIETLNERIKPIAAMADRIQEAMIEKMG